MHLSKCCSGLLICLFAVLIGTLLPPFIGAASAQTADCTKCHAALIKEKVVHAAVQMGCESCHSGIDPKKVPHPKTSKKSKDLAAEQAGLCYTCHEQVKFTKKNVHGAIGMGGCTGCHNPHSSPNEKLLVSSAPDICFTCHDKAEFTKKNVHVPVQAGMCLSCHNPHSSDNVALLNKAPLDTCLECHPGVAKKAHAIRGFSASGHPLGQNEADDPKRKGKKFYCGSCHNPHSSDSMKLFRYPASSAMALCGNCHRF